jgi:hypothetical protein
MNKLTQYEMVILNFLMFKHEATFTEMNVDKLPSDHFIYPLKN